MPKKTSPLLNQNLLVPFLGSDAEEIKDIAHRNGVPTTLVTRILVKKGLKLAREEKSLSLELE